MSTVVAETNPRLNITISPHDLKMLKLWGYVHGKPAGTYASQILAARIEANRDTIMLLLRDVAELEGISVDELKTKILGDDD